MSTDTESLSAVPAQAGARTDRLLEAQFDPRLKTYVYVGGILGCLVTVVGIVLLPFWLVLGRLYIKRYYESLSCELTTRALRFKKGIWFQTERTIPLDKIQDLTFKEGPILRYFGLSTLKVETAGQSGSGESDMSLTGIVESRTFRERVLDQRDKTTERHSDTHDPTTSTDGNEQILLLKEIHGTLKNIEKKLGEG